jgi:hypothetical protein
MLSQLLLMPGLYFVFTEMDRLIVDAEPAIAVIPVQQGGRTLVHLPELEFLLTVSSHCANGGLPESVSVTIADTRRTLRGDALPEDGSIDISVVVAANQLAPFALQEFCIGPESEGESVLLKSALTAHASLRCAREREPSIVFAVEPLDIRADCIRSAAETELAD